jgi:hypothetical protein
MPYNNNRRVIKSIRTYASKPVGTTSPKAPTVGSRLLSEWATEVAPTSFNTVFSLCFRLPRSQLLSMREKQDVQIRSIKPARQDAVTAGIASYRVSSVITGYGLTLVIFDPSRLIPAINPLCPNMNA